MGFPTRSQSRQDVLAMFDRGEFDVATLFYSKFQSALTQIPTKQQLIPVPLECGER